MHACPLIDFQRRLLYDRHQLITLMERMMNITSELDAKVAADLLQIGLALAENIDLESLLRSVGETAQRVLEADVAVCIAYDHENNKYRTFDDVGQVRDVNLQRTPRDNGSTATIVKHRSELFSQNAQSEDTPFRDSPFTIAEKVQSVIGFPLLKGDEVVGVLYINYRRPNMISEKVRRVGRILASQAAIAIYNARLIERLSDQEKAMTRLVTVVGGISEALAKGEQTSTKPTVKLVLDETARAACELMNADCAVIYPYDTARAEFLEIGKVASYGIWKPFELTDRPRSSSGMAAYVGREGLVVMKDIVPGSSTSQSPFIQREQIRAFVGVAVCTGHSNLGILYVSFRKPHKFTDDELRLVTLFAGQAAVALQVARLLEREQKERSDLETQESFNTLGSTLAHRAANIGGTIPVRVDMIREKLTEIGIVHDDIEDDLQHISNVSLKFHEMAKRIGSQTKRGNGTPELTDINELLSQEAHTLVLPPLSLIERYDQNLPLTYILASNMKEVFHNIIQNATEHTPSGGTITIETYFSERKLIEVRVTDTGKGIESAKWETIFDLGYSERGGLGLGYGLWQARRVIRRYGGRILVDSTPGKGSTFTVVIPVIASPAI